MSSSRRDDSNVFMCDGRDRGEDFGLGRMLRRAERHNYG